MPTITEKKFVGEVAAEQIIANVKDALNEKQPKGDYALASDIPNLVNGTGTSHALRGTATAEEADGYYLGYAAMAIGNNTKASGEQAFAEGSNTQATGMHSHAEGYESIAAGQATHAEGGNTQANGLYSHAEGSYTQANGDNSHAEGSFTKANGSSSHAEGTSSEANAANSHAEGYKTHADSSEQHVQGRRNISDADGKYAHIVGNGDDWEPSNAHTLDWNGVGWFAGGLQVGGTAQDDGARSVLLSGDTTPNPNAITFTGAVTGTYDGSAAKTVNIPTGETIHYIEGTGSTAGTWLGTCEDITEYYDGLTIAYKIGVAGASTTTLNINGLGAKTVKRATSNLTTQLGVNAVVHLTYTTIDGVGYWVWANYDSGNTKVTQSQSSTATGKYPVILSYYTQDKTTTTAQTVRRDNNFYYQPSTGTLTVDTVNGALANSLTFTGAVTGTYDGSEAVSINIPDSWPKNILDGSVEGSVRTVSATAEDDTYTMGLYSLAEGQETRAVGKASHAEGYLTAAFGDYSHAEGKGNANVPSTITSSSSNDDIIATWTSSSSSDKFTLAKGLASHAEGFNTIALKAGSHAEGEFTISSANGSHAEGYWTNALDVGAHSEGSSTTASGKYSHAEGNSTIASSESQHVQGKFNVEDSAKKYAHIVGNGVDTNTRSNAHTLDWDGVGWFAGGLKVGGTGQDDTAAVEVALKSDLAATPQNYGYTGSGDATTAFQNALTNNRRVFVPGGDYYISGELVIGDNCELELAQDAVLYFTQTSGNCISMKQCAHLKGNHATVSVPYAFSGNVINADAGLSTSVTECPPFAKWDPQWKTGRYITNLNIVKPDTRGFYYSMDGSCSGTAVYICTDGSDTSTFMWGVNFSGLRIAGAFSYGIRAVNVGSGYNHEMRIEALIDACEIGVSVENVNNAYISTIVQPRAAFTTSETYVPYAKHGIQLIDSRNADLSGSRVWDWNANSSLWSVGGEYQHIAMRGNCSGSILNDFFYYEMPNYDIRSLIYTDTSSNLEKINILQEPFTRWFKPIDNKPHFFNGDDDQELVEKRTLDTMISFGERPDFTDQLAIAGDGSGAVFNEIGYNRNALWDQNGANLTSSSWVGCTGYIACKAGQVIRVRGMSFVGATDDSRIIIFDSNYTKISHFNASVIPTATYFLSYASTDDGFDITVLPNGNCANTAYVKFNVPSATITTNPVIAVNENITYTYEGSLSDAIKIQIDQVDGLSEILGSYINDVDALIGGDS